MEREGLIWSPLLGERARVRGTAILGNLEAHPKRPTALHPLTVHGERGPHMVPSPWGEGKGEGPRDSRQPGSSPEKTHCPPLAHGSRRGGLIWSPLLGERARVMGTAILGNLEAHPKRPTALHPLTVHGERGPHMVPSPWGEGQGEGDRDSRQSGSSPEKTHCPPLAHGSR